MRVLLIQALSMDEASAERVYPIGIVSLAAHVEHKGYQVELLDMNVETDPFGSLKEKLLSLKPEVVAVSLRNIDPLANKTSSLIPRFIVTVRMAARLLPKAWIIAGGTGFSLFPERLMLEIPEIHYGIIGEAEISFPALLASLEKPSSIKGLCVRKGNRVIAAPPSMEFDMKNDYLHPSRKLLDPAPYLKANSYVPAIGIETKRGCPYNCSYCVYPNLQGKKLRCRTPEGIVDEIEFLTKEFAIHRFHFNDPIVNAPLGHLEQICEELLHRNLQIKWGGFFREDNINKENVSLFERAGCECFAFSPDGLCQEALDTLRKNLTEEDILKAAEHVSKSDVVSIYHFMVNVPGETDGTVKKGIRLLERIYDIHALKKNLGTIILNNIRILPGTPMETIALEQGVIDNDTDLLYPTYYNPKPFDKLRYKLETLHLCRNIFMWQEVR
ncbi:MAG: B12 lower ligand biosynthesis radical SAM protein BzaD [Clostridia bacterium]|nr:B12 lower ligand biosynthesis radical SAM protein BzaD [Clostridia bacterium]MBS3969995.1 B12 lower ligand biosynthesis radical SAM protein BzaD [Clostridia bacterium]